MRIYIIGPGGVGKSSSGVILADLLGVHCVDLDLEFSKRIQNIGVFIRTEGYKLYCRKNSELFYELLTCQADDSVFVLSSGFLVHEECPEIAQKHVRTIAQTGTSILLLPAKSLQVSTDIVVKRQLHRGFGLKEDREREKFRNRFSRYQSYGDIQIYSTEQPKIIAEKMFTEITWVRSNGT